MILSVMGAILAGADVNSCTVSTRKVRTFYKTKTPVNCMELLHPRLPTDEATKSIYDDINTTDKCIIPCDCRLILFISLY